MENEINKDLHSGRCPEPLAPIPTGRHGRGNDFALIAYAQGQTLETFYQRYAIADESMLKDAAEKLERLHSVDEEGRNDKVAARS